MADIDLDRNPIDVLAEEFAQQQRNGAGTSISEYCQRHPDLADQIRELFPAIVAMERLKGRNSRRSERESISVPPRLGDFRMVREIGRGGMGVVYEAEQESLARRVAVKIFSQAVLRDVKHLQRFEREAKTAARLHHTNIVPVFGVGHHDGLHYYVMQLIRGRGLDEVLHELQRLRTGTREPQTNSSDIITHAAIPPDNLFSAADAARWLRSGRFTARTSGSSGSGLQEAEDGGRPEKEPRADPTTRPLGPDPGASEPASAQENSPHSPDTNHPAHDSTRPGDPWQERRYWESVATIGVQVAEALQYAHSQRVLHRDIKPANLLLDARGTVWITDFGLAKAVAQDDVSRSGDIVGTLRYMSPEQLDGKCDARSDVYSLGLTLYELLTLRPAFDEPERTRLIQRVTKGNPTPPRKLVPQVPRDLETIVLKATAVDSSRRYRTAGDLATDLRCFLEDLPIRARRATPLERLWRWSRRNPAIAALSLMLLVALAGVTWKWREVEAEKSRVQAEKTRAESESTRAEVNLTLALDTLERVLQQFSSSWMAHPTEPQMGDEQDSDGVEFRVVASAETSIRVLEDFLAFYNRFATQTTEQVRGNPRLRRDTAKANQHVGEIRERLNRLPEAEEAYLRALGLYQVLSQDYPDNTTYVREIAATYNQLASVRLLMGPDRMFEAHETSQKALALLTAQLEKEPCEGCQFELARTHEILGRLPRRPRGSEPFESTGRLEPEDHLQKALRILDELIGTDPANPEYRFAQARTYRHVSMAAARRREPEGAAEARAKAMDLLKQLQADFPGVPDYQCELVEVLTSRRFGPRGPFERRELDPRQVAEHETELREAIQLAKDLNRKYPSIPRYQTSLTWSGWLLAGLLRQTGRAAEAVPLYQENIAMLRSLTEQYPKLASYPMYLSGTYQAVGETYLELNQPYEADRALEEALQRDPPPEQTDGRAFGFWKSRVAQNHELRGRALRDQQRYAESKAALEQAIEAQQQLLEMVEQGGPLRASSTGRPGTGRPASDAGFLSRLKLDIQQRLSNQYESLADTLDRLDDPEAAQAARDQAAKGRESLPGGPPPPDVTPPPLQPPA